MLCRPRHRHGLPEILNLVERSSSFLPKSLQHRTFRQSVSPSLVSGQQFFPLGKKSAILKLFKCFYCTKTFSSSSTKARHERIHTGRGFKCELCFKVYDSRTKLRRHIAAIHEQTRFRCEHCHKSFTQLDNMRTHKRQVCEKVDWTSWKYLMGLKVVDIN